jgi:hypothetical protein
MSPVLVLPKDRVHIRIRRNIGQSRFSYFSNPFSSISLKARDGSTRNGEFQIKLIGAFALQ